MKASAKEHGICRICQEWRSQESKTDARLVPCLAGVGKVWSHSMEKIQVPFFEVGPKAYLYGQDALDLAIEAEQASLETGV